MFAECLNGFLTDLSAPPGSNGSQSHLHDGMFLFPNTTIQCSGNIKRVRFAAYFNPGVRYNSTLSAQILFYAQLGSQYMLATSHNLLLNLEAIAGTQPDLLIDPSGRYYFSRPRVFLQSVLNEPMQVSPGYTLGVGVPPTESLPSGVVSHGLSILVRDDMSSPVIKAMQDSCWNPSAMRSEPCSVILDKPVRPVVLLEFTKEGM